MAHVRAQPLKRAVPFLGLLPVALWLAGVFPMDVARVCAGVLFLGAILARKFELELTPWFVRTAVVLLALVPLAVGLHQAARVVAGLQGVDFALFAQAAHSIAVSGVPTTTLLFDEPINFLTHHFAPVLYAPGLVTWLGVPAPFALIGCYALAFGLSLWALRRFCLGAGLSPALATVWTLLVALSQSIRPEILWGVHDEIFALPLLGWSLVLLQERRWLPSLALAAACAVAKESFFVLPLCWLGLAWFVQRPPRRVLVIGAIVSVLWLAAGVAYVFGMPWWSGREFDHLNKFELRALTNPEHLASRALFLAALLVPLLGFPFRTRAALAWCLPALPFVGLCLLSSDAEMFRPAGYHATVPAFLLGFAGAVGVKTSEGRVLASPMVVLALLAAQLSWGANSLWLPLRQAREAQWYPAPELQQIPKDLWVAADPAAVLALLDHPKLTRLWRLPTAKQPPQVLVFKPTGWEQPGPEVRARYPSCSEPTQWAMLCGPR